MSIIQQSIVYDYKIICIIKGVFLHGIRKSYYIVMGAASVALRLPEMRLQINLRHCKVIKLREN